MTRPCDDCGAAPHEPCTWPCSAHHDGGSNGRDLTARPEHINR